MLSLQWMGIGVVSGVLVAGFSFYGTPSKRLSQESMPTIGILDQQIDATQHLKKCGADEVFRVSDRGCYQLQGE